MDSRNTILSTHMGTDFTKLAPLLQAAHTGKSVLRGKAQVKRGKLLSRLLCTIFRFPKVGDNVELLVNCEHTSDSMVWNRDFDGLKMKSSFKLQGDYLIESLGPLAMYFKAVEKDGALHYLFVKTKFMGVFLPNFLSPQVVASEQEVEGKYRFSVEVRMFLIGFVIAYSGELKVHRL
jgi:hypothetical protein